MDHKIEAYLSNVLNVITAGTVITLSLLVESRFLLDRKIAKFLGLFIIFIGMVFAFLAIIHIKGGIFGMVRPRLDVLVKEGPYKFIRHPYYLGITIILIGVTVTLRSWIGLKMSILLFLPSVIYRAKLEENALACKFGAEWKNYTSSTGFILPFTKKR